MNLQLTGTEGLENRNMNKQQLLTGFDHIIRGVYDGKTFYVRMHKFFHLFKSNKQDPVTISFFRLGLLIKPLFLLGCFDSSRKDFWRLILWSFRRKPEVIFLAITYSIYGYYFRKAYNKAF
ncbi:MAG: DUF4070 domain-containing protein [Bacteroidales bacterium]|nr:DUF4070 domain-containing protein [Bacteroidota bacterium]MBL6949667.1 DUF4070 domain-containing protein [Bacteroidales bacterium]